MTRVTRAELDAIVTRINKITKSPEKYMVDNVLQPGNFHLDSAYGGSSLRRNTQTGEVDVLECGYLSNGELARLLHAFIRGLNTG